MGDDKEQVDALGKRVEDVAFNSLRLSQTMNLLAIDTSTARASVALSLAGVIYTATEDNVSEHARCLLPMIERLLKTVDVSLAELDGVVFGRGPGSFTGLRIACSVAKGLAYAHDLPLYPVSGLAAIAYSCYQQHREPPLGSAVLAMIDARMQQLYWARYDHDGDASLEQVTSLQTVMVALSSPVVIAGVGLDDYFTALPQGVESSFILSRHTVYPEAAALIGLVQEGRVLPVTAALAAPVYVRNQVTQGQGGGRG